MLDNGIHTTVTLWLKKKWASHVLQKVIKKKEFHNSLHFMWKVTTSVICWWNTRLVTIISKRKGIETGISLSQECKAPWEVGTPVNGVVMFNCH